MATYYVSTTGNDSNAGNSTAAPWATITRAFDSTPAAGSILAAGDTVIIEAGTYTENPVIDVVGTVLASITVRGVGSGWSTLTTGQFNALTKPVTIAGQVTTSRSSGTTGYYRFENIAQSGASGTGWDLGNLTYMCWINCSANSNTGASSDGFSCKSTSRFIACEANSNGRDGWNQLDSAAETMFYYGCLAKDNARYGFHTYTNGVFLAFCTAHNNATGNFYSGISPASGFAAIHCTSDGPATNGYRVGGRFNSLINCIMSNCTTGWTGYSAATEHTIDIANLTYSNSTDRTNAPTGYNSTSGDPLYTDRAGDDFTLQQTSPCVNAGWPSSSDIGSKQIQVARGIRIVDGGLCQ